MQSARSTLATRTMLTAACLAALGVWACDESTPTSGHDPAMHAARLTPDIHRQLAGLRERTAQFHRFEAAFDAGWNSPIPRCFDDPELGAMGFHYGNPGLIDGTVDAMEPELLLYEPQKNGRFRFVAVEYIVPFTAWTSAEPPQLYGQSFMRNEAFQIWALHVWHERENPRGIFADWNPKVSCRFAR